MDAEVAEAIVTLRNAAAELPVEYFEAKPERAIGFEEIVAAVVPDDSSEELLERLKEAGVRTVQYQTWDDADRVYKVNEIQEARFSLKKKGGRGGKANSDSGVLWAGSETAMDRPAAAEYNEAGKGQSTSSSNGSSGILWAGSDAVPVERDSSSDEIFQKGQNVLKNFDINDAYVKSKHLSTTGGNGAKFLGNSKSEAESILKDAIKNGIVQSIADNGKTSQGKQSFEIVIETGKTVGTKRETLVKIILSEDGGMLSAYPIN